MLWAVGVSLVGGRFIAVKRWGEFGEVEVHAC